MNTRFLNGEYALVLGIMAILIVDLLQPKFMSRRTALWLSLGTLALSLIGIVVYCLGVSAESFSGLVAIDPLGTFTKIFLLVASATLFLMIERSREFDRSFAELFAMLLTVIFGCFLMISAKNLLMVYLGMETMSIISYLLAGVRKQDYRSNEAALKYVVYGSLASAVMIFGMSYLYGVTGSLDFTAMNQALMTKRIGADLLWLSLAMVFAGFGYKISAAPFHMWTPDVYEGSPLPITAFFSVVPKTAGIVALGRFLFTAFSQVDSGTAQLSFVQNIHWNYVLSAVAVITMFVGNLAALQQSNMKRLLAYSSISHAGFLLLGLSAMDRVGFASTLFYAVIYYFMNLGAFWIALEVMELTGSESVDAFKGLAGREPVLAVLMMVFLFSLTGLPPFAGFVSKWYVFAAVIQKGMVGAAVAAVLNTVIALFYYARIVRLMFFDKPLAEFAVKGNVATLTVTVVGALAAPTLILGLYWEPVYRVVKASTVLLGLPQ